MRTGFYGAGPPLQKALYYITLQGESVCNNTMCALAHEWGRVKMETSPTKLV